MAAGAVRPLTFEEAWPFLQEEAINRIIDGLDGVETRQFTSEEYMLLPVGHLVVGGICDAIFGRTVYNVCEPNPIGPEVQKLYDYYKKTFEDYISSKVEECLNQEKGRVSDYLKFRSKYNVVEIVQHELLVVHASKLEEKKRVSEAAA
ncbi:UNVERIFIED_CONTAM: Cullin-1 [Sesamum indicum]